MTGTSLRKEMSGNNGKTSAWEFDVNLEGRRYVEILINCNHAPLARISQLYCPHCSYYAVKKMYSNVEIGFTWVVVVRSFHNVRSPCDFMWLLTAARISHVTTAILGA